MEEIEVKRTMNVWISSFLILLIIGIIILVMKKSSIWWYILLFLVIAPTLSYLIVTMYAVNTTSITKSEESTA